MSGHRAIVAAGSPVFHAMLYGNMKESNQKEIDLPSVDTNSLQHLLKFMYTGQVKATPDDCCGLLLAARYFNVTALETKCIDRIVFSLNSLNCCRFIIFAVQQQVDLLLDECYYYMEDNMDKIIHTPEFKLLPAQSMAKICGNSDLYVKELDLFFAVQEWSDYQKELLPEDIIKAIFLLVRYPLIHITDLIEIVGPSNQADPYLYKIALEYHLLPSSFSGPQDQIEIRRYFFNFRSTSPGMFIEHNPKGTFIKNQEDGSCMCFAFVVPTESNPVRFKVCLRHFGNVKLLAGFKESKTYIRLPVSSSQLYIEIDGYITVKNDLLQLKVGDETASTVYKGLKISFGVYIKNKGGEVLITKM